MVAELFALRRKESRARESAIKMRVSLPYLAFTASFTGIDGGSVLAQEELLWFERSTCELFVLITRMGCPGEGGRVASCLCCRETNYLMENWNSERFFINSSTYAHNYQQWRME